MTAPRHNTLTARRLGIDTHHEPVVFVRADSTVCRSEGFSVRARVELRSGERHLVATMFHVTSDILSDGEAGLSDSAWNRLALREGDVVSFHHPETLQSFGAVRGKAYGKVLDPASAHAIVQDIVRGHYSDVHISSFVTACTARPLDFDEIVGLTQAMVDTGDRVTWPRAPVVDKHSVGGLPGNRTTPIIVAIVAANGLCMPKTSSRAITSPAGTADTMEVLAPVDLDLAAMRRVVEREGGCIAWGGAVRLSPADDLLIRVERALDIDSEGQLVASVLSKKIAAGATCVVVDIPVGPTAKIRTAATAGSLAATLHAVAAAFGMECPSVVSDGMQPVGRGIGPALEAKDVLAVLAGAQDAPNDLRLRALTLAATVLEAGGGAPKGQGFAVADETLKSGRALRKFEAICEAQGGRRVIPEASHVTEVRALSSGKVQEIDNRRLALVAKLAGAPDAKAAGVELHVRMGEPVEAGDPLYSIHAQSAGELAYAAEFAARNMDILDVGEPA